MKTKRILSFVMASLMTLTCFFAILPMKASAAYSESTVGTAVLPKDTVKKIVEAAYKYEYETAEEMLAFELSEGYLDSVAYRDADGSLLYTLYVNRYTGVIYYKNEKTGQILTSNPTDIGAVTKGKTDENKTAMQLYSQLIISYSEIATSTSREYNSTRDAAVRAQIHGEKIQAAQQKETLMCLKSHQKHFHLLYLLQPSQFRRYRITSECMECMDMRHSSRNRK